MDLTSKDVIQVCTACGATQDWTEFMAGEPTCACDADKVHVNVPDKVDDDWEPYVSKSDKIENFIQAAMHHSSRLIVGGFLLMVMAVMGYYSGQMAYHSVLDAIHLDTSDQGVPLALVGLMDSASLVAAGVFTIYSLWLTYVATPRRRRRDVPDAYQGLTAGSVKIKMAISWITYTSIFLLQTFVKLDNQGNVAGEALAWKSFDMKAYIHLALIGGFIAVGVVVVWMDRQHKKVAAE